MTEATLTAMRTALIAALLLLASLRASAGESVHDGGAAAAPEAAAPGEAIDEEQAAEREHAQKLRRAREELEERRTETARRLWAEQLRQMELTRLQSAISGAARRESDLGHEIYRAQRERDAIPVTATDPSSVARRSDLDHRLYYYRSELERASALRQSGTRELNGLLLR